MPTEDQKRPMRYFMWAATAIILIIDVVGPDVWNWATESRVLADDSIRWLGLPFMSGVLVGHWFFNRANVNYDLWPYGLGILAFITAWDCWTYYHPSNNVWLNTVRYPGIWAVLGIPAGSYLWGQRWTGKLLWWNRPREEVTTDGDQENG